MRSRLACCTICIHRKEQTKNKMIPAWKFHQRENRGRKFLRDSRYILGGKLGGNGNLATRYVDPTHPSTEDFISLVPGLVCVTCHWEEKLWKKEYREETISTSIVPPAILRRRFCPFPSALPSPYHPPRAIRIREIRADYSSLPDILFAPTTTKRIGLSRALMQERDRENRTRGSCFL